MPTGWPQGKQEITGALSQGMKVLDPASPMWEQVPSKGGDACAKRSCRGFPKPTIDMGLERTLLRAREQFPSSKQSWIFLSSRESR